MIDVSTSSSFLVQTCEPTHQCADSSKDESAQTREQNRAPLASTVRMRIRCTPEPGLIPHAFWAKWCEGVTLSMTKVCPEYLDAHHYDRLTIADVLFREEPDEDEEEEDDKKDENDREEGDEDDDQNGGYSV